MVNPCVYGYRKAVMRVRSFPLFRRFVVAIMAGLVFTLIMSWFNYTPVDQRIEHIYYYSYSSLVVGGLIYVMPIFLIIGIPVSVLLDLILFRSRVRNRIAGYLLSLIMTRLAECSRRPSLCSCFVAGDSTRPSTEDFMLCFWLPSWHRGCFCTFP